MGVVVWWVVGGGYGGRRWGDGDCPPLEFSVGRGVELVRVVMRWVRMHEERTEFLSIIDNRYRRSINHRLSESSMILSIQ